MTRVFVSSCRIDGPLAAALIERLRVESFTVSHSPRAPSDGEDTRWRDWYRSGCRAELEKADIFVCVISPGWDCSTWMAHESEEASKLAGAGMLWRNYFWNTEQIKVEAAGMVPYLKERLPDDLDKLILSLRGVAL